MILNLLFIFITVQSNETKSNSNPEWCWTVPDMKVKLQTHKFGYNYGLCQQSKPGASPELKTKITVKMPNIKGFGGDSGPFKMRLSSKEIQGDEFELKAAPFKPDENYVSSFVLPSVGEVQTVELSMDDKDTGNFACEMITIEDGPKNYEFPCSGIMDKRNKQLTIIKQDTIEHDIVLTAGKEESDQSKDPLFIAIKGSKGVSDFQILSEEGVQAEPFKNSVELPDMGKFECLYIKSYGADELLLTKIHFQAVGGEPIEFNNEDRQKIECPQQCEVAFCKGGTPPPSPPPPPPNEDEDAGIDDENDSPPAEPESPYKDTMKYNCAKLNVKEKDHMKSLSCKTTAIQIFEEETFLNNNINVQVRYGLCPPNCMKDSVVMGRGIHSPVSTICGSAIADGSLPKSGGCVAIHKVKGLNSYPKSKISYGMKVETGSASAWGFITQKADNPDFSKSDLRILNHKGEPDYQGRVEFRVSGRWGTVNFKGTEQSSAKYICKSMNYVWGEWMNDSDTKDFCETYLEKDYCGFKGQEVHYQSYKCEGEVESLADCYREISQEFNHKDDAIIKCSMVDKGVTADVSPKEGQIRMIGTDGAPAQSPLGRVEMFHDKKWGSVCNKGFVDASANIACKELGFTGGKSIGGPGAHKACIIGKEDYCEKEGATMIVESLKCSGKEKRIKDCGGNYKSKCSNFQSTIIKCDGTDGDTSGQTPPASDGPPQKTPRPEFGNLPLASPYLLLCETILNPKDFPGDPGSMYLGFCPPGCQNSDSILRGTSIYTHDSSICKAAIHSGVLQPKGGPITIIISYGQNAYEKNLNRRVESEAFKFSKKSFMIASVLSIHKAWSLVNYFAPLLGLVAPHSMHLTQPALKHNPAQFLQLKSKILHTEISSVAKNFRRYLQKNALLQLKSGQEKKLFEWVAPKNFMFSPKIQPDFSDLETDDSLRQLYKFTIMMQFEFDKDNGVVELFGHSECQCWGLMYDEDGLKFGEKCTTNMINLGFQISQNIKYHIGLTYDKKSMNLILVVNGKTIYHDKHSLNFQCNQQVNIGYNSFSRAKFLIGKIYYVQVIGQVIPPGALEERTIAAIPTGIKTPKNGADTPDGQKVFKTTQDQRKCVSPCITDPFPEQPNSPEPPLPAVLGGPPGGPGSEGPPAPVDGEPQEEEAEGEQKEEPVQTAGCKDLTCDDSLELPIFNGEVGKQQCVFCPKGCTKTDQMVIGVQIFYKTSSICKAGIHDGKIQDKTGGEMIVVLQNPIKHYQGSNENDVNSKQLQVDDPSIGFSLKVSVKTYDLKCDTLGTDPIFEKVLGNIKVKCPVKCSLIPNTVYGIGKYADLSQICQAAIHAGASSDNGGSFQLQFIKPQLIYDNLRKNQIISQKYDNTNQGVKRGMVFIANRADAAGYFKEKYEDDIFDKWYKIDDSGALKGPGDWKFEMHPKEPEKTCIMQDSHIQMKTPGLYGTKLFHKDFDADSALLKVNTWQDKKSEFAIFIRYYDDNNYYSFKFNVPGESQIILVKRVAGVDKVMGQYQEDIPLKQWNRLYIVFDAQVISLNMQEGDYRNIPKIISVVDPDVQRGKIALATNDENSVYFDGVWAQPYYENQGIMDYKATNIRNWDDCLKPVNQKHRDRYCQKVNGNAKWAIPICKKLINYCEYCCTDIIMRWERIIHYDCIKSCVKSTRNHEAMLRSQQEDESKPYIPKIGDKIDYMNEKTRKFIPANVKDVKPGDEDDTLIVSVSYFVANGEFKKLDVDFPDKRGRIQKCGKILQSRNDCAED